MTSLFVDMSFRLGRSERFRSKGEAGCRGVVWAGNREARILNFSEIRAAGERGCQELVINLRHRSVVHMDGAVTSALRGWEKTAVFASRVIERPFGRGSFFFMEFDLEIERFRQSGYPNG